ncbi:MAG: hypothetical protein R2710_01695 [Acidimicrobiales bacterium]
MVTRPVHLMVAGLVLAGLGASCSEEKATIVDLNATTTTAAADTATGSSVSMAPFTDEIDPDDPNAEARQQVIDAARQQCLDDPTLDEGVVRIVVEATGEIANEYRVDCAEVRAEEG